MNLRDVILYVFSNLESNPKKLFNTTKNRKTS